MAYSIFKKSFIAMKTVVQIIFSLSILITISCENQNETDKDIITDDLVSSYTTPVYNDSTITFTKTSSLKEDEYGFSILNEHVFFERKNSGWCGTPPIAYKDFEGTWSRNNDTINITVGYWGGLIDYVWEIIHLDEKKLTIKKIN